MKEYYSDKLFIFNEKLSKLPAPFLEIKICHSFPCENASCFWSSNSLKKNIIYLMFFWLKDFILTEFIANTHLKK